jgi:hypothetical protein
MGSGRLTRAFGISSGGVLMAWQNYDCAILLVVVVTIIAVLCWYWQCRPLNTQRVNNGYCAATTLQATVITTQAFNFNRFNQVARTPTALIR